MQPEVHTTAADQNGTIHDLSLSRQTVLAFSLVVGSGMGAFGVFELLFGSRLTAALDILTGGALTAVAIAVLLRRPIELLTRWFVCILYAFIAAVILGSGGASTGTILVIPVLAFVVAVLERPAVILLWTLGAWALIVVAYLLRQSSYEFPITFDPDWIAASPYRTPGILALFCVLLAYYYRTGIERTQRLAEANVTKWRAASRESKALHNRLLDFSEQLDADWFWETDRDGRLTYLSEGFEKLTSIPVEKAIGLSGADVYRLFSQQSVDDKEFMAAMNQGVPFADQKLTWLRANGQPVIAVNYGSPFTNEHGAIIGYRGVVRDVTEATQLTDSLHRLATTDELTLLHNRRAVIACAARVR